MRPSPLNLLVFVLAYRTSEAQNQSATKCDLPENISQLPDFAQEEIRAVWRNYVPGDDCKRELIITDDILAVLDMLDKDLERHTTKTENKLSTESKTEQTTTAFPLEHETLIPTRAIETGLTINNTLPSLRLQTEPTTTLSPIVVASDPTTQEPVMPDNGDIDYSDFTTTSASNVEPSRYTVAQKTPHKSVESSEQPFAFTGSPSVTFSPEFTPTTRLVQDYVEPTEESVTSRAVRIMKVKIPTDYEDFEKLKHANGYIEHRGNFKKEKTEKDVHNERFFESLEPPLPFLKGASQQVIRLFKEVMNDPDVVSEQRRQEEIHLLAVSYLTAKQLGAFNVWSSERRKRIRAREQMLYPLSFKAREALKHLALTPSDQERRETAHDLPGELRDELKAFAIRLREQHQPTEQLTDDYRRRHV